MVNGDRKEGWTRIPGEIATMMRAKQKTFGTLKSIEDIRAMVDF